MKRRQMSHNEIQEHDLKEQAHMKRTSNRIFWMTRVLEMAIENQ
jgi:hypothetical protein